MAGIRIGVIGAGTLGTRHCRVYHSMPDTQLCAICDINIENAEKAAARLEPEISFYSDYKEMLSKENLDAVAVAVPDANHREPVVAALEAGCHVLVEKPLATTLKDCDEMIEASINNDRILMTNFSQRWMPEYYITKQRIQSGEIGTIAMAYMRRNDSIEIMRKWPWLAQSSPAAFLSSHDIDLVRWYSESKAISVFAKAYKRVLPQQGYNTYDLIQALVEFENGAFATFESGFILPATNPSLTNTFSEIVCEKGYVHINWDSGQMQYAGSAGYSLPRFGSACEIDGKIQGAFRLSLEHFCECIRSNSKPIITCDDARHVTEVIEGIHLSIETGTIVRLPLGCE